MRDLMLCIVLAISLEPVCTLLFFYLLLFRQSFVSVAIRNFLRYTNYARKSLLAVSQPFTFTFFYSVIVFYADFFQNARLAITISVEELKEFIEEVMVDARFRT